MSSITDKLEFRFATKREVELLVDLVTGEDMSTLSTNDQETIDCLTTSLHEFLLELT